MKVSLNKGDFFEVADLKIIIDKAKFVLLDEFTQEETTNVAVELYITYSNEGITVNVIKENIVYASKCSLYDAIVETVMDTRSNNGNHA